MKENITRLKRNIYTYKIIITGFVLAIFYVIVEAIVDSYIFMRRENFLQDIFTTDLHEIFMRVIVVCLILLISLISQKLITEQIKTNKIKKSLITRISHELKTPLNTIHSASHVLLNYYKDDLNETTLEYNEIIYKGTLRLKKLIEDLIDISRLEKYKLELNKKKENISNIIRDCALEITYLAKNRNLSLNLNIPEKVFLEVDRIRIEQVLNNVLSNAIKNTVFFYKTEEFGQIFIKLEDNDDYISISVEDTGVGFTEKEKGSLFKRFGKIERREEQLGIDHEGSGLGLYISKEIVELHGGQILVESEGRNKGSTFKIRLYKLH